MLGSFAIALTTAHAIKCVNETLPPRVRFKCSLIKVRFSINNVAGTVRTLVAVGTLKLSSMFVTTRPAGPRKISGSTTAGVSAVGAAVTIGAAGSLGETCSLTSVIAGAGITTPSVLSFTSVRSPGT